MNKNLLLIGAGQHGQVVKEAAETMSFFEKIDFLDDASDLAVGKLEVYEQLSHEYSYAFVAVGDSEFRLTWIQRLEEACYTIPAIIHGTAIVSQSAQVHMGSFVGANAVVGPHSVIAIGCILSAGAIVDHNTFLGDGCHLGCGAVVEANVLAFAHTRIKAGNVYRRSDVEFTFSCEKSIEAESIHDI